MKTFKSLSEDTKAIAFILFTLAICSLPVASYNHESAELKAENAVKSVMESVVQAKAVYKPQLVSLGEFKITYYCSCKECTGDGDGITASGTVATVNRTVGVDPSIIPLGTVIYIGGQAYVAEDTGSGINGNEIDMYVSDHQEALNLGVSYIEVFIERGDVIDCIK